MKELIEKLVFEALGEVSMCWSETPKGVFESNKATEIGNKLTEAIQALQQQEWISVEDRLPHDEMNCLEFFDMIKNEWCVSEEQYKPFWNDVLTFARKYHKERIGKITKI